MRFLGSLRAFLQRGRRGWADRDTWSFDTYLAGVIADGLRYLRGHQHGHPASVESEGAWDVILGDMIFAFDYLRGDPSVPKEWSPDWYDRMAAIDAQYPEIPRTALTEGEFDRYRQGWLYFREHFTSLWD